MRRPDSRADVAQRRQPGRFGDRPDVQDPVPVFGSDPERERGEVGSRLGGLVSVTEAAERCPPVAACGHAANSRHTRVRTKAPYRYTATAAFSHLRDDAAAPWQGQ